MTVIQVSDKLWISGQPGNGDMQNAKDAGVVRVINNRPESEDSDQPRVDTARSEARSMGMDYVHIPVRPGQIGQADVDAFHKALAEAPGPVLAHCRSGARSLSLYAIGEVQAGRIDVGSLDTLSSRSGIDLSAVKTWLDQR